MMLMKNCDKIKTVAMKALIVVTLHSCPRKCDFIALYCIYLARYIYYVPYKSDLFWNHMW